jgi:hypothetical protein
VKARRAFCSGRSASLAIGMRFPLRVLAPQRWLRCMGDLLRIRLFRLPYTRGRCDHAHNRLSTGMDVDVLNRDLLVPFAWAPTERLNESGRRAGQLASLA